MERISFNVPSISCSSCSGKIQDGIRKIPGVGKIAVDLKSQTVEVEYNPSDIQPNDIRQMILSMGYEVLQ